MIIEISSPVICSVQAGNPGKQAVKLQSESESLRIRRTNSVSSGPSLKAWEVEGPWYKSILRAEEPPQQSGRLWSLDRVAATLIASLYYKYLR